MSGSATDVFQAVVTKWQASPTLAAIRGPYRDREPAEGGTFPYCIFKTPVNAQESATNASEYWRHLVEFTVYAATPEAVEPQVEAIGAVFDSWTVTLSGSLGHILKTRRVSESYGEEDPSVFRGTLTYEIVRRKPR